MGGTDYQLLLTEEARRATLQSIFGHRFGHQGKLQLPATAQYNSLSNNEGLQAVGIEICRWIGLKPNGLTIAFDKTGMGEGFAVNTDTKTIHISPAYKNHPYSAGALLAFAVTSYAAQKLDHSLPNKEFIEFASLELGLGVWVANALSPKVKFHHKLYHLIDSTWHQHEALELSSYKPSQYIQLLSKYAHDNRIAADTYLPHILQRNQYLFNSFTRSQSSRYLPESHVTTTHKRAARLFLVKLFMASLIVALAITFAVFISTNSNGSTNPENDAELQNIEQLRNNYSACQNEASKQQSSYDPNDLFLTRQVDATKSRCESLRNQYNYAIDQYNKN